MMMVIIFVIAAAAVAAYFYYQKRRSERLHGRFGPEYRRAVDQFGDRRRAESELEQREKRVQRFNIRTLAPEDRQRFADEWRRAQARFVDEPGAAINEAHHLVNQVMEARGYPVSSEFERNAKDLSVDHPRVVEHYRTACEIAARQEAGEASTEDLRKGMVHYRELFEDLLGTRVTQSEEVRR
jgi:hypothetical protein